MARSWICSSALHINNETAAGKPLRTLGGPWSVFRRMRCLIGGSLIGDIDYYNRVHEMIHVLTSNSNRENDDVEGFGYRWDSRSDYGGWSTARVGGIPSNNTASP